MADTMAWMPGAVGPPPSKMPRWASWENWEDGKPAHSDEASSGSFEDALATFRKKNANKPKEAWWGLADWEKGGQKGGWGQSGGFSQDMSAQVAGAMASFAKAKGGALPALPMSANMDPNSPDGEMVKVLDFLARHNLSQYGTAFKDSGFDTMESVKAMQMQDMAIECGMAKEDSEVLAKAIALELAGGGNGMPRAASSSGDDATLMRSLLAGGGAPQPGGLAAAIMQQAMADPMGQQQPQIVGAAESGSSTQPADHASATWAWSTDPWSKGASQESGQNSWSSGGAQASAPCNAAMGQAGLWTTPEAGAWTGGSQGSAWGCGAQGCGAQGCGAQGCGALGCGDQGCGAQGCGAQGCCAQGCGVPGDAWGGSCQGGAWASGGCMPDGMQANAWGKGGMQDGMQADPQAAAAAAAAAIAMGAAVDPSAGAGAMDAAIDPNNGAATLYALAQLAEESAQYATAAAAFCAVPRSMGEITEVANAAEQAGKRASWAAKVVSEYEPQGDDKLGPDGDSWLATIKGIVTQAANSAEQAVNNCRDNVETQRKKEFFDNPPREGERRCRVPCRRFFETGQCPKGPDCPFSHDQRDIAPRLLKHKRPEICTYWQQNKCIRGSGCTFAHGQEELATIIAVKEEEEVRRAKKLDIRTQMRPGDWECPQCGDLQFARNARCRRCGHGRERTALPQKKDRDDKT